MLTKWKYMTQQFSTEGMTVEAVVERRHAEMSLMGEYGWELVSTNVYHSPDTGGEVFILFYKKPAADALSPAPPGRR